MVKEDRDVFLNQVLLLKLKRRAKHKKAEE